ncbi:inositol polyphosphate 1-phosphatase [Eurytemora carolleeae]|uniref:inositol polyphosphate 1-phosphatase n=1 Tax=Eurytemora carolleeae TaxID=1294199 RepID=UPI000C774205|nr:inositol polyphosphate 1-phosphatase [Eurytemora carolleeae]|eukprot:XP_023328718.1 inositol polyphosphate 1-phosphatase-like [Eurytemora affinis]
MRAFAEALITACLKESVRFELGLFSPVLKERIYGEESASFTNSSGVTVNLNLNSSHQNTRNTLVQILDGNEKVAEILATEVHKAVELSEDLKTQVEDLETTELDISDVGVWIDPIDGTSHYIKGKEKLWNGYPVSGLEVAKVLIGVYNCTTGAPMFGVVGSPFSATCHLVFGSTQPGQPLLLDPPGPLLHPNLELNLTRPVLVVGSSESSEILEKLKPRFEIISAGGAGNKLMMVLIGTADLYINSSPSELP